MREIKFRIWDMTNDENEIPYMLYPTSNEILPMNDMYIEDHREQLKLMQFTGLQDRNGKDVYEGDLIKGDGYGPYPVFWDDEHCGFCSCCYSDSEPISRYKTIEVIGNKFENSELLEEDE